MIRIPLQESLYNLHFIHQKLEYLLTQANASCSKNDKQKKDDITKGNKDKSKTKSLYLL